MREAGESGSDYSRGRVFSCLRQIVCVVESYCAARQLCGSRRSVEVTLVCIFFLLPIHFSPRPCFPVQFPPCHQLSWARLSWLCWRVAPTFVLKLLDSFSASTTTTHSHPNSNLAPEIQLRDNPRRGPPHSTSQSRLTINQPPLLDPPLHTCEVLL
jgi:hypothetical protein